MHCSPHLVRVQKAQDKPRVETYTAEVKDPNNPGKKFSPLAWFYPEKTEEVKKAVLKPVRRTCVTATSSHRDVRCTDGAGGKMVGAGRHLTSRGTFEPYKPANVGGSKKKKRTLMQQAADSMASSIACCDKAFNFFKGTYLQCCSRSRLCMLSCTLLRSTGISPP